MCSDCAAEMTYADIEDAMPAVEASVTWLDKVKPNWRELVDWINLEIEDANRCIAAQVFREEAESSYDVSNGYSYLEKWYPSVFYSEDYAFSGWEDYSARQMTKVWKAWHENDSK